MISLPFYLVAALFVGTAFGLGTYKHVTVMGQAGCGKTSMSGVTVELWEKDRTDPDDLLNTTKTDSKGNFRIYGGQKEVGNIEPYLRIIHSCDNGHIAPKCVIKDTYTIPKERINGVYDMGIVSLNIAKENRKKKCN